MSKPLRPVYEWRWVERQSADGKSEPDKVTRSARQAAIYKRFAEKFGGRVVRKVAGMRVSIP